MCGWWDKCTHQYNTGMKKKRKSLAARLNENAEWKPDYLLRGQTARWRRQMWLWLRCSMMKATPSNHRRRLTDTLMWQDWNGWDTLSFTHPLESDFQWFPSQTSLTKLWKSLSSHLKNFPKSQRVYSPSPNHYSSSLTLPKESDKTYKTAAAQSLRRLSVNVCLKILFVCFFFYWAAVVHFLTFNTFLWKHIWQFFALIWATDTRPPFCKNRPLPPFFSLSAQIPTWLSPRPLKKCQEVLIVTC